MILRGCKGAWFIHSTIIHHLYEDTVLGNGKWPWKCKIDSVGDGSKEEGRRGKKDVLDFKK